MRGVALSNPTRAMFSGLPNSEIIINLKEEPRDITVYLQVMYIVQGVLYNGPCSNPKCQPFAKCWGIQPNVT